MTEQQLEELKKNLKYICYDVWKEYDIIIKADLDILQYKFKDDLPSEILNMRSQLLDIFDNELFMRLNYNLKWKDTSSTNSNVEFSFDYLYNLYYHINHDKYICISESFNKTRLVLEYEETQFHYIVKELLDKNYMNNYKITLNNTLNKFKKFKNILNEYRKEIQDFNTWNQLNLKYNPFSTFIVSASNIHKTNIENIISQIKEIKC